MAENNKTVDASTDDLEDFEALFEGRAEETVKEEPKEEGEEPEADEAEEEIDADDNSADNDDSSATEEEESDDEPEEGEEETAEEEEDSKPKGKKKKNSVQDRIDELTAARREAEREADRWRAIAEERERNQNKGKEEESNTKDSNAEPEVAAPDVTDKDKYPLGDLDPQYQADLLDYKLEQRIAQLEKERQTSEQQKAEQARQAALQQEWETKMQDAETRHENYRETVASLEGEFKGVDPAHGQFIAETVMRMENGPDVLYHLATNPDTVREIINSNPVNAALALGRLEASLATDSGPKRKVKETKAPPPPKSVNKGNKVSLSVKPDTDDLDAFEDVFFDSKK